MSQEPVKVKFQNVEMDIMGAIRVIPEMELTVYPDGTRTMSFDEYNRILWELHREWMEKRRIRY